MVGGRVLPVDEETLTTHSDSPGQGARFAIRIPGTSPRPSKWRSVAGRAGA